MCSGQTVHSSKSSDDDESLVMDEEEDDAIFRSKVIYLNQNQLLNKFIQFEIVLKNIADEGRIVGRHWFVGVFGGETGRQQP